MSEKPSVPNIVTTKDLAAVLGLSGRRVRQRGDQRVFPPVVDQKGTKIDSKGLPQNNFYFFLCCMRSKLDASERADEIAPWSNGWVPWMKPKSGGLWVGKPCWSARAVSSA
jgi:hypothetical protein